MKIKEKNKAEDKRWSRNWVRMNKENERNKDSNNRRRSSMKEGKGKRIKESNMYIYRKRE